jgi:hypothetical protein
MRLRKEAAKTKRKLISLLKTKSLSEIQIQIRSWPKSVKISPAGIKTDKGLKKIFP